MGGRRVVNEENVDRYCSMDNNNAVPVPQTTPAENLS